MVGDSEEFGLARGPLAPDSCVGEGVEERLAELRRLGLVEDAAAFPFELRAPFPGSLRAFQSFRSESMIWPYRRLPLLFRSDTSIFPDF